MEAQPCRFLAAVLPPGSQPPSLSSVHVSKAQPSWAWWLGASLHMRALDRKLLSGLHDTKMLVPRGPKMGVEARSDFSVIYFQ